MDELLHDGKKGMKWGVVNWRKPGGKSGKSRAPGRMKQEWDSMKRERHWKGVLKDMDKLTTKQIGQVSKRLDLENELKRLSKGKKGIKRFDDNKHKQDYRLRAKMSDQELGRKVGRLRVQASLRSKVKEATKDQTEIGKKIAASGGSLLLTYVENKKISVGDVYGAVRNPKSLKDVQTQVQALAINTIVKKVKGG